MRSNPLWQNARDTHKSSYVDSRNADVILDMLKLGEIERTEARFGLAQCGWFKAEIDEVVS